MSARAPLSAWIGLGANLGAAVATVHRAIDAIAALPQCRLVARSALYQTAPVDALGPDFINAVVEIETTLTAPALLEQLLGIERAMGRSRPYRNAPRHIDLDLLMFGDACVESPALVLPHPRMRQRAFVLVPLSEIAPQRVPLPWLADVAHQMIQRL